MSLYSALLKPVLFQLDPELAHGLSMGALSTLNLVPAAARAARAGSHADRPALAMDVSGLHFPNPIGLGAGLDKNASAMLGLYGLGFGSLEVGTVTPRPQPGNDRPRLFRLPEHQALINRMGFNNVGMQAMAERLRALKWKPGPVGVNIGKNKDTPLERATEDYVACATTLGPLCDYLAINLSSPNTPGLRTLQEGPALEALLRAVRAAAGARPTYLKLAPDLGDEAIDAAVDVARATGIDGLICTNTTITRPFEHRHAAQAGGLSGAPLAARATQVIRRVFLRTQGAMPIIGVGGIFTGKDAWEKVCAGASLVQLYTGFIYRGPTAVSDVARELEAELRAAGLERLAQAVGRDADAKVSAA